MELLPGTTTRSARDGSSRPLSLLLAASGLFALLTGCVSKGNAAARERAAYLAGQQEAIARMQQMQSQTGGPSVVVNGEVRNHSVPWSAGMTLAKAIVAAEYVGANDPRQIIIVHQGVARRVELQQLLSGPDIPLQPGDIIQLMSQSTAPQQ